MGAVLALFSWLGASAFSANCPSQVWDTAASLEATLAANDCRLTDRLPGRTETNISQQFTLDIAAKGIYTIDLSSSEFDTILLLTDARFQQVAVNNDTTRNDSRVVAHLTPETYHLFVISNRGNGAFRLQASFAEQSSCAIREIAGTEFTARMDSSLGNGSCRLSDVLAPASSALAAEVFHFRVEQPRLLDARMLSRAIDSYLIVADAPTGRLIDADDDGDDGFANARLVISLEPGDYYLIATLSGGTSGAYTMEARLAPLSNCETRDLRAGDTASGQLAASDCRLLDLFPGSTQENRADLYRVQLSDAGVLGIDLNSANLPAAAFVLDADGKLVVSGSAQIANQAVRFSVSLKAGEYRIGATSGSVAAGNYQLRTSFDVLRTCTPEPLTPETTVAGTLSSADCRVLDIAVSPSTDATAAKPYQITLEKRSSVTLNMTSAQIDSYLMALDREGRVLAEDDNSGGGRNAQLTLRLNAGTYTVLANTGTAAGGSFELKASAADPRECPVDELNFADLAPGQVTAQDCATRDVMTASGRSVPARFHTFTLAEPGSVSIEFCSGAFLPALTLVDGEGRRIASDEPAINEYRGAAHIRRTLPAGRYGVVVSATAGRAGAYTLRALFRKQP